MPTLARNTALATLTILFGFFCVPTHAHAATTLLKPPNNLSLVGYWSFDEGTGTQATDFSGRGNTGTLSGSTLPAWTSGKRGKALRFDGSSGYRHTDDDQLFGHHRLRLV